MFSALKRALGDKPGPEGPKRVLVVDDEDAVRRFVARALQEAGYETLMADDGPTALAVAEKEASIDILVTDLMMPQMNGDELARRMLVLRPKLKVLYLTGFSEQLFKDRIALWQDEAFLEKPCTIEGLLQAVSLITLGHVEPT